MRTLRFGDYGDDVKTLQNLLNQRGYVVQITGIFDTQTTNAVRNFQRANRDDQGRLLVADTIVGPKTWGALTRGSSPNVITTSPPPQPADNDNRVVLVGLALAGVALFFLWN